jgi:ribosomal protein L11 methyltransferase
LTPRVQLIPLWQASRAIPKGKTPLYLETTSAFGTGLHETTRFSAELIESLDGKFESFFDIGTGSGILLILARKMGVARSVGIDMDAGAVRVARENLKANGLSEKGVGVQNIMTHRTTRTFDLVVANLVTQDLLSFSSSIVPCVKPGGHLIVSGISTKNAAMFLRDFPDASLRRVRVRRGKEWIAALFQKSAQ